VRERTLGHRGNERCPGPDEGKMLESAFQKRRGIAGDAEGGSGPERGASQTRPC